ncbi:beta-glucosidase family protein [Veronia pacifica]|uniref:beta-glucosidase family protein n=1 Tax=Veronia pacifica TaxID=1080227 RepID=UPI0009F46C6A|nr:glycoside hydrolase family 3 C-terminal domain-containing protein [Veronia pacifica]
MKTESSANGQPDRLNNTAQKKKRLERKVERLVRQMSLKDKLHQMSGDLYTLTSFLPDMIIRYNMHPIPAGHCPELGIPALLFADGPRGVVCGTSTCFPVSMARGASWDIELEERIGDVIGVEMRSHGANYAGSVCINLLRHPAWGRAQETYGEDTHHLGELGAALVRGIQRHGMACAKHFAVNSIENARFKVDVHVSERTLREVYLPHFKRCVDEGVASVMSAYNKLNGERCSESDFLLRKILKEEWKFDGFVLSDFLFAIRSATKALKGGLDVEMPYSWHYSFFLWLSLKLGRVSEQDVNEAVTRILRKKFEFQDVGEDHRYSSRAINCSEHIALAKEAADKSIVLLKNEEIQAGKALLPLDLTQKQTVAVIGKLAEAQNTGDHGSSAVDANHVVTALQGLKSLTSDTDVCLSYDDATSISKATRLASEADTVILCVGYTHMDEGEFLIYSGGDRDSLSLNPLDERLINSVVNTNSNTVVVMFGGSAIVTEKWRQKVPAILMAWYAGEQGGNALADILFGKVNPSAKLPCSFPRGNDDLPYFTKNTRFIRYEYLHGYRHLEHYGRPPAFAMGFGLSYSQFLYSNLTLSADSIDAEQSLTVSIDVENVSETDGAEIIQLYISYPQTVFRAPKDLKAFRRVDIAAHNTVSVFMTVTAEQLRYFDEASGRWQSEPGQYQVHVGSSSQAIDLLTLPFTVQ